MTDRPNIILFMPETLRADAVFGDHPRRAQTPNMDALGDEGVRFENCYAQHSVCSPSRISMFTGLYPHTTGKRTLANLLRPFEHNMFRDLRDAGYETIVVGKNDLMFPDTTKLSFDKWNVDTLTGDMGPGYPHDGEDRLRYSFIHGKVGDYTGNCEDQDWACIQDVLKFLEQPHNKPFCILIAMSYVHPPYRAPEPFHSMYDRSKMPEPWTALRDNKRRYVSMIHEQYGLEKLTEHEWREIRALYLAMTSRVDDQLGQVMDKLKTTGHWDDTALLVFSDHGDFVGDYGLVEKWFSACEDSILRVPFIMRVPGRGALGSRQCLTEMVDLYPTVLDIAGIKDTHYHFGKSLMPLCDPSAEDAHREVVFGEGGHNPDEAYIHDIAWQYSGVYYMKHHLWHEDPLVMSKSWMVRDRNYKFVYCPDEIDELYDMKADPAEIANLAGEPGMAGVVSCMKEHLLQWLSRTADQVPEDESRCPWPE